MEIGTGFGIIGLFGCTVEQWSRAGVQATMSILNVTGESDNVDPLRGLILRELRDAGVRRREEEQEEQKEEEQERCMEGPGQLWIHRGTTPPAPRIVQTMLQPEPPEEL